MSTDYYGTNNQVKSNLKFLELHFLDSREEISSLLNSSGISKFCYLNPK